MNPLSVGLFVDSYYPVVDGVTIAVENYAACLRALGHRVCIVTPRVPGYRDDRDEEVIRVPSLPTVVRPPYRIGVPFLDLGLPARLHDRHFSIVHAHSPFSAGALAFSCARTEDIPIVATFHSKFRDNLARVIPFRHVVDREIRRVAKFFDEADEVWIPQASVAGPLREYGYTGPFRVMENGTDFSATGERYVFRLRGQHLLGLSDRTCAGLYVGQLIWEKNLAFLLEAADTVRREVEDFRLILVGSGPAESGLRALANRLRLGEHVAFFGAVRDREALRAIFARGDLLMFPSVYDNAPLVLREAAAMGTPALLLRNTTSAEAIEDGVNGFLGDGDVTGYAKRASAILRDARLRDSAGARARETLARPWNDVVRDVALRYQALIATRINRFVTGTV